MRRVLVALMSAVLLLSSSMPVMAMENETNESTNVIETRDSVQGLKYETGVFCIDYYEAVVRPSSGSNLNVWVKSSNGVAINVIDADNDQIVAHTSQLSAGEHDIQLYYGCDGGNYKVRFINHSGAVIDYLIYQWD